MLDTITGFFEKHLKNTKDGIKENSTSDKIQLASAALLIELCRTDQKIDQQETETLMGILTEQFNLDQESIDELVTLAHQEATDATSLYQFTSLFNEEYEYNDKIQLIKNMWEVAYADGNLDRYEDSLIRQIADLMYISHSDFIKTKLSVKNQLNED